jgi:hypothetical protein
MTSQLRRWHFVHDVCDKTEVLATGSCLLGIHTTNLRKIYWEWQTSKSFNTPRRESSVVCPEFALESFFSVFSHPFRWQPFKQYGHIVDGWYVTADNTGFGEWARTSSLTSKPLASRLCQQLGKVTGKELWINHCRSLLKYCLRICLEAQRETVKNLTSLIMKVFQHLWTPFLCWVARALPI